MYHQVFFLRSFFSSNSLVSRSFWSFFFSLQETIAKTDNRPINIDIFSFLLYLILNIWVSGTIFLVQYYFF
jgi:hypothetical protein